jgi:hypothetical protein
MDLAAQRPKETKKVSLHNRLKILKEATDTKGIVRWASYSL